MITLNGTTGITTPDITSDSYTGPLNVSASAPDNSLVVNSAGNVGIGAASPNANAILDVSSTTKAFMPPRMSTAQRDAIASPTAGMIIYNTTTLGFDLYTTTWGSASKPHVGVFTRDQAGAAGNVSYTGVGFKPSAISFIANINNQTGRSIGFDNGVVRYCSAEATNGTNRAFTSDSIVLLDNSSWSQQGMVASFDSDGFTITWTIGGAGSAGTMQIYFTAFR